MMYFIQVNTKIETGHLGIGRFFSLNVFCFIFNNVRNVHAHLEFQSYVCGFQHWKSWFTTKIQNKSRLLFILRIAARKGLVRVFMTCVKSDNGVGL